MEKEKMILEEELNEHNGQCPSCDGGCRCGKDCVDGDAKANCQTEEGADACETEEGADMCKAKEPEKCQDKESCESRELPKKSELLAEQKDLVDQYNKGIEEIMNKEFEVNVVNKSQFDKLCKFVEKDIKVTNMNAANVIMLHSNLKNQKPQTRVDGWDGKIKMNIASCRALWQGFRDWDGRGVFDATSFLTLVQLVGPEVSKVLADNNKDLIPLNGLHTRLSEIDDILDRGEYEDDVPEEKAETVVKDAEERVDKIGEEVDPDSLM